MRSRTGAKIPMTPHQAHAEALGVQRGPRKLTHRHHYFNQGPMREGTRATSLMTPHSTQTKGPEMQ